MSENAQPNTVFIGKRPLMNYVLVAIRLFNHENAEEIKIKARGRNICKAVDMVEYLRNTYSKDIGLKSLNIFDEELLDEKGNKRNVTSIEIVITKGKNAPQF
ncbi:MAG: DNA/RNA-binding protein AlbA [Caldisphaera sp.]|jgi:DNA-binding protein|nr:DNA-binding protein Alba [Caldisphaera sp.]PMP60545.1 MAG: RNA-binding protein [Caldisphaera sp.]PMP89651.1 MAG: RNA-binding protein [Caldisphaera sp.]